ncbi:hypothetical protein Q8F55_002210 [Vanrija albida]|uniref:Iron permease FTR1 n=1 Tax=Vanrija albida TaxID=181172 RepID=A0ABR3Q972_9TREE
MMDRTLYTCSVAVVVATFIALRETLEAGIIIAVLLGFIEQLIPHRPSELGSGSRTLLVPPASAADDAAYDTFGTPRRNSERAPRIPPELLSPTLSARTFDSDRLSISDDGNDEDAPAPRFDRAALVRTLTLQVWSGALLGLAAASVLGGIFLYVFYTFAHDLWQDAENLWEGIFCGIAALIILVMGIAFLRLPHARTKWRLKLLHAVENEAGVSDRGSKHHRRRVRARAARGWILFGLPFITVLREGLEGVVFLGGIGVTDKPKAIFFGALAGFAIGGALAYTLFSKSEGMTLQRFTTVSTLILFIVGAGLASRSAYSLERQYFINGVGADAAESGDGPGSFRVRGNIWKFTWGNPEVGHEGYSGWWQLAQSLCGWNNVGTWWTVGTYEAYWIVIIATLVRLKWKEGRTDLFGHKSKRGWELHKRRRVAARQEGEEEGLLAPADEPEASGSGSGSRDDQ